MGHLSDCGVDMRHKKLCLDTEILDRSEPYGGRLAVLPSVHEQLQATPGFLRITVVCTPWGHLQETPLYAVDSQLGRSATISNGIWLDHAIDPQWRHLHFKTHAIDFTQWRHL